MKQQTTPTKVLWGGAIIAPLVCLISFLDFALDYDKISVLSKLWAVFIIVFTAYYSYVFIRDLKARLRTTKAAK